MEQPNFILIEKIDNQVVFEKNNPQTFIGMYKFWCQKL